jgi:type IV pilus assembly protein PilY1
MVYVGANDGMLHAFKLGKLTVADGADTGISGSNARIAGFVKASLTGGNLGEEQWAYIPRSTLPYLKYFTDAVNYKHIFYLDGPTILSDVSVGKSGAFSSDYSLYPKDESAGTNWKTVLIGSMGLGGASRLSTNACLTAATGGTCVKTPIFDPDDSATPKTKGVGYSSYFALDVTDQYFDSTTGALANQPVLKWEFPPRDAADNFGLGYATSGAAIIRIAAKLPAVANGVIKPDITKNGKWFAVFASGPTGPIDTTVHRFMGRSDQNLKLFVVDLGATVDAANPFELNTNYWVIDTGITEAFGGSVVNGAIDTDRWSSGLDGNYQDDALYVGYTKKRTDVATAEVSWTDGGVGRLLTKESTDPATWAFSKVIDGIGPVTTGISRLQDRNNKKLWLYFGTGRFYYTGDDTLSDTYKQRYLMGVQEPCYTTANKIDPACSVNQMTLANLKDQTTSISSTLEESQGWYVALDAKDDSSSLGAERSITDPVALTNGAVFFTTFKPTTDVCKYGGYSYIWGFNYATGGAASVAALTGKALVQVSTGAFEEVTLSTALTASSGRKMASPMVGKPPADAPPIVSNASNKPAKKILHLQEK